MILRNELPKFLLWYCLFLSSYSELKEITPWQTDLDRERNNFSRLSYNNDNSANDFYKSLKDAALLQGDTEAQQNLTHLINNNYTQYEPNMEGGEKQIRSALLTQLRNVAALAGQQVPRFSWQSDPVHFENRITKDLRNKSESPPLVQRNVRESDSAAKVAAKQTELQQLLQQLYQAEATVQMEVGEVTRSQQIATEAEQKLEEATNKVRMLSSDLQAAQENAATCAMRAHTAQLQLAAHDQLMFTARQRVDALSAQMVSVQAELASVQNSFTLNESSLHLEQQGRLNNIYQFQSGLTGNNINQDQPIAAAPPPPPGSLLVVPPGSGEQQSYPVYKGPEQQGPPQKK